MQLYGRAKEVRALRGLLDPGVAQHGSQAIVIRGEPGIGKTALLDDVDAAAAGHQALRVAGVECEATLRYSALSTMFHPYQGLLDELPPPQASAMRAALGLDYSGPAEADRLHVGLASAGLLRLIARSRPVVCVVDDAHLLDWHSADALTVAARRLPANVSLIVAADRHGFVGPELPELHLSGLNHAASAELLVAVAGDLAVNVRERVLAEARGNPQAVVELARALTRDQRCGRELLDPLHLGALPVDATRARFESRLGRLTRGSAALLTVMAVDNTGRLDVVVPAARSLGASDRDLARAERVGLVRVVDRRVEFQHPLCRQAVYSSADVALRAAAQTALADALMSVGEETAAGWQRAAAAIGPDEKLAVTLEHGSDGARAMGGHPAEAAFCLRAADLSPQVPQKVQRLVRAACALSASGQIDRADEVADRALSLTSDPDVRVRLAEVRSTAEAERGSHRDAAWTLLRAAAVVPSDRPEEAAAMLMGAARYAWFGRYREVLVGAAEQLSTLPLSTDAYAAVAGVEGMASVLGGDTVGGLAAFRIMARTATRPDANLPPELSIHAAGCALLAGDDQAASAIAAKVVDSCEAVDHFGLLPAGLHLLAAATMFLGNHDDARATADHGLGVARDLGLKRQRNHLAGIVARLDALAGDEESCRDRTGVIDVDPDDVTATAWAAEPLGLLALGLGRYDEVLHRLRAIVVAPYRLTIPGLCAVPDYLEAAALAGRPELGGELLEAFDEYAKHSGQPWMEAVALRCRALLAPDEAGFIFEEAVQLCQQTRVRPFERARTELRFGEWLRRNRHRVDARTHLRSALETFTALGAGPWAERARTELRAAGMSKAGQQGSCTGVMELTTQELHVVRMAAQGMSNDEIAAQLFISPRTVGYHLWKAFPKLGVSKRIELVTLDLNGAE